MIRPLSTGLWKTEETYGLVYYVVVVPPLHYFCEVKTASSMLLSKPISQDMSSRGLKRV
jgi:hypothetical protein